MITIFLNEERYLGEAVESVLAQTYSNWELLLCDDGSTDSSPALARGYASRHPERIRVLAHPFRENRGMSATRNLGLRHSKGTLVAFLDADDVWLPEKLERQVTALDESPQAAMVYGPSLYWHSWTGRAEDELRDSRTRLVTRPGRVAKGSTILSRVLRGRGEPPATCSFLARRDAVMEVGGFEDRFRGLCEDQVLLAKILIPNEVLVLDDCYDLYRQHPDSCCAVANGVSGMTIAGRLEYLRWLQGYLKLCSVGLVLRWDVTRELWIHRLPMLAQGRERLRERVRAVPGRLAMVSFSVGRRLLPEGIRQWLWRKILRGRRTLTEPPGIPPAPVSSRGVSPRSPRG